jgi:hypothetical protein
MRFCTKCGSPVSGMLRFCTRCGAVTSSTAGAGAAGAAAPGTVEAGAAAISTIEAGTAEVAAAAQDFAGPADTATATGIPGPGTRSAVAPVTPAHPGSPPVIPVQFGVADAESGGLPPGHTFPAEATVPEPDQPEPDQPEPDPHRTDQPGADEVTPALATDQSGLASQDSPAPPATTLPTGMSEDDGPLRLVRIDAEPGDEAWPEDPWLPGSRRPDRRALIIGVVLIAGLLSVASTAWLVRVSPPQASSPQGTHRSRPSRLGPGHGQPRQALSSQPTPILTQPSQPQPQPAPTQTSTSPARPSHTGLSQSGHSQPGHNQSSSGHPGTSRSGTGHSPSGQPGASQTGTHRTGSGQAGPGQPGSGQGSSQNGSGHTGSGQSKSGHTGSGQGKPAQDKPGQSGPGQAGSGPSGTGHSGTGRGTTPTVPHPRRSAPGSRGGGAPRHSRPGVVSISRGLAGRADARLVGGLLVRYFAAVNHRQYWAYASLFAQRRQLTPRDVAWGYQTSHDSNAVLVGIAALKGGLKATVTFTSFQDPAKSPDHSSCIDWRITLFLHRTGATYLIGMPPPGYQAGIQACSFAPRQSSQGHSGHRTAKHSSSAHRSSQHPGPRHSTAEHPTSRHATSGHSASRHSASGPGRRKHR